MSERTQAPGPAKLDEEGQKAVDTVGAMLRAFGAEAFDVAGLTAKALADTAEGWAKHVLLGAPRPGATASPPASARRDWAGVRQFFLEHRKNEKRHVARSVADLRGLVASIVGSLAEALPAEDAMDDAARARLQSLREVAMSGDLEELRETALVTVTEVTSLIDKRQGERKRQLAELQARVSNLGSALAVAQREGETDPLTGLGNRKRFDAELAKAAERSAVLGEPSSLLVLDVDRFKALNDAHGHPGGDAVLRALADCLARTFPRKSDGLARYGGEEFAVILRDATLAETGRLAERLLTNVRALRVPFGEKTLACTVSVGYAQLADGETTSAWVARADAALYRAKQSGRDRAIAG